jgi:hypothetical protein
MRHHRVVHTEIGRTRGVDANQFFRLRRRGSRQHDRHNKGQRRQGARNTKHGLSPLSLFGATIY